MSAPTFSRKFSVSKLATESGRHYVTGWAYVSQDEDGAPVVDHSGEHIPINELDTMASDLLPQLAQADSSGVMHQASGPVRIVQSLVLTPERREALGLGKGFAGWVVVLEVTDEAVWGRVLAGQYPSLSIEGMAIREDVTNASN
jgi:hypothetical protein